eukprot:2842769-Pleurochrysis_carterae.AAC.1
MLDGQDGAAATVSYTAGDAGVALCARGAPRGKVDAPIITIKDLQAAGIAHAPNPLRVPPLSPAELEAQDEYMLHLDELHERQLRERHRDPEERYLIAT